MDSVDALNPDVTLPRHNSKFCVLAVWSKALTRLQLMWELETELMFAEADTDTTASTTSPAAHAAGMVTATLVNDKAP